MKYERDHTLIPYPNPNSSTSPHFNRQAYIPKKLEEVMNYERDHARLSEGRDTGAFGFGLVGLGVRPDGYGTKLCAMLHSVRFFP